MKHWSNRPRRERSERMPLGGSTLRPRLFQTLIAAGHVGSPDERREGARWVLIHLGNVARLDAEAGRRPLTRAELEALATAGAGLVDELRKLGITERDGRAP